MSCSRAVSDRVAEYTIHLEDLTVTMGLGIHAAERAAPQRVVLNVAMTCRYDAAPPDRIDAVVDYDFLRTGIHKLVESRHFELQEVLCDQVAALAFSDPRVIRVRVRSAKPDIYPDARIGCEIVRERKATPPAPSVAPQGFTREALERSGFSGWIPFSQLRTADCPPRGGVYVVHYPAAAMPEFNPVSCGGWFKARDPAVSADALAANWVPGAEIVYIGKADNLRRRLREFADFGAGKPVGHWGGRLIWQLPDPDALRVAWKETPDQMPVDAESALIEAFSDAFGKPPFANRPDRLGR